MCPPDERGEVSSEFFKRLNQQIVQKDNLIKLLQLQIKNLKAQLEEGESSIKKKEEIQALLDEKEAEIKKLKQELEEHKAKLIEIEREKEEKIKVLNELLEKSKSKEEPNEAKTFELEQTVENLKQELEKINHELEQKNIEIKTNANLINDLNSKIKNLETQLQEERNEKTVINELNQNLNQKLQELQDLLNKKESESASITSLQHENQKLNEELEKLQKQLLEKEQELNTKNNENDKLRLQILELDQVKNKVLELEQDNQTLKNLLTEKDELINQLQAKLMKSASSEDVSYYVIQINEWKQKAEDLQARLHELEQKYAEISKNMISKDEELLSLKSRLLEVEKQAEAMAEASLKLTAISNEKEQLEIQIKENEEIIRKQVLEIENLKNRIYGLEEELTKERLEKNDLLKNQDLNLRKEIENLTNQIADQLLAIQKFEELLKKTQEQLIQKDKEIEELKSKLPKENENKAIEISDTADVISGFIDFFDGLDAFLSKKPIPELQALHKKLLERLIIPNQISYMPVISEEYDETKHIATDFFRSNKFPEKCIVFEVEKGYQKGDKVIKKAKVWVVQNLYNCRSCNTLQSNPESRFCHMCGAKIVAPNGLPVENLPYFEPTPTTYLKFAERMFEKNQFDEAERYLNEGLLLDPNFIPLLVKKAELHTLRSEFEQAINLLKRAEQIKPDSKISEQIKALEVKNTIYQQARALNLPPEELEKLVSLIQK